MTTELFILLGLCIALPAIASRFLRADRLIPLALSQILFGALLRASGLCDWLKSVGADPLGGPLGLSVESIGGLGVALLVAFAGAEAMPRGDRSGSRRFVPISILGFGATLLAGAGLGAWLHGRDTALGGDAARPLPFALAIGLCLAVTALPVLVGIVKDAGLTRTRAGSTALMCAVLDDLWLWLGLALVLSLSGARTRSPLVPLALCAAFFAAMVFGVRPLLRRVQARRAPRSLTPAEGLCVILLSAACTQAIGIHPFIGAFMGGVVLPREAHRAWGEAMSEVATSVLVPVFFVSTGMRLHLSAGSGDFWLLVALFTGTAIVVKGLAVALAARATGLTWSEGLLMGSMMQCKGLMELVAINILRDAGIVGDQVFSALAVMTMICTLITAPLLAMRENRRPARMPLGADEPTR